MHSPARAWAHGGAVGLARRIEEELYRAIFREIASVTDLLQYTTADDFYATRYCIRFTGSFSGSSAESLRPPRNHRSQDTTVYESETRLLPHAHTQLMNWGMACSATSAKLTMTHDTG
jgi:hypothetical protein